MMKTVWLSLLALIVGAAIGVLYSWVIAPMRYVDTVPSTLRGDFKDSFRSAIAASYAATHNLERARTRLALLGDTNPVDALSGQAQRMLAAGEPFQTVQDVAELASDLGSGVVVIQPSATSRPVTSTATLRSVPSASPSPTEPMTITPEASATTAPTEAAFDTPTPRPTRTAIPTASTPFQLVSQAEVCNPNLTDGLLQISVLDSRRHQMPGVEISISWGGGEEQFFTGLKPDIADGYADYIMQAGVTYTVQVEHSGTPVAGLVAPSCPGADGQTYLGGLKLVFQQP